MNQKYDFQSFVDRESMGSAKWMLMKQWNPNVRKGIVPLSVADMELKTPPEIIEGLREFLTDDLIMGYTLPWEGYFEAVKNWMRNRHGWEIDPEWIVGTAGVVNAFFQAVIAFTEPGDGVIIMTPIYYPMQLAVERNNRKVVRNPLIFKDNKYAIDFDDLEKKAKDPGTKLILLCSPHNPVGRVWTKEELEKVGRICIDNNVLVLSDEVHQDIILPGYKHIVFAGISEEFAQNSVTCTGPSKTFNIAGLQISNNMVPNPTLREKFEECIKRTTLFPKLNILGYKACEIAYRKCGQWLDELILHVHHNSGVLEKCLAEKLPQVKCIDLEGTYLQWMDFRELGIDHLKLEEILHMEAEVFFDEGYIFGEEGIGFERINLACPTTQVEEAVDRIEGAVRPYIK